MFWQNDKSHVVFFNVAFSIEITWKYEINLQCAKKSLRSSSCRHDQWKSSSIVHKRKNIFWFITNTNETECIDVKKKYVAWTDLLKKKRIFVCYLKSVAVAIYSVLWKKNALIFDNLHWDFAKKTELIRNKNVSKLKFRNLFLKQQKNKKVKLPFFLFFERDQMQ